MKMSKYTKPTFFIHVLRYLSFSLKKCTSKERLSIMYYLSLSVVGTWFGLEYCYAFYLFVLFCPISNLFCIIWVTQGSTQDSFESQGSFQQVRIALWDPQTQGPLRFFGGSLLSNQFNSLSWRLKGFSVLFVNQMAIQ